MKFNTSKTRVTGFSLRQSDEAEGIKLGKETIKMMVEFCYLDSKISGHSANYIQQRLTTARKAFLKTRNLIPSNINLSVRKSFLKAFLQWQ